MDDSVIIKTLMQSKVNVYIANRSLVVLGFVGFLQVALMAFLVTNAGSFSEAERLSSPILGVVLRNFTLSGDIVSILFWSVLSLTAGVLVLQAFFRISSIIGTTISALAIGTLIISVAVTVAVLSTLATSAYNHLVQPLLLLKFSYATMLLFASAFVSFLALIVREIITATFSPKVIDS